MQDDVLRVLHGQLTTLLTGISVKDAADIVHPQLGMPGRFEYPSAYNCNKWLEGRRCPPKPLALPPQQEYLPPTPEERERVSKMVSAFKAAVALDKKWTPNLKRCGPERSDPDKLLEALDNREGNSDG